MFDIPSLIKYILEGAATAVAMGLVLLYSKKKIDYINIAIVALTAAAMFAILDQFSPVIASGVRRGSGFGVGLQQIGMGEGDPCVMKEGVCAPNTEMVDPNTVVCKREGDQCVIQPTPDAVVDTVEGFEGFSKTM